MDKELIEVNFIRIDNYMTELFHSRLNEKQIELVKAISHEIASLYSEFEV